MAELQRTTNAGEMVQRFIEFVMMHAQNAALFLGQIPHPQSGQPEVNLELAKMFIDQLVMIEEKTRGNLSNDETTVLRNALSNLQLAYVEAARGEPKTASPREASPPVKEEKIEASPGTEAPPPSPTIEGEGESRKKFTKSYGA